ncbi:Serpentine Receptor, class H [Caenorhabditis elegans]|uniref:Serpentine Receptor, class H n=1 Tax=Caenorhabditis elegans TaxID=6239 RepID=O45356_CAEEL|nr:Serpentine Receptor, class H [Caenorhabditis elegans]CAB07578.2 Serpentine Receptor, class H [Caenorhabditis elegans]|eukprot:NP_507140.2 Serpentine Receptor, class I [Caenorhabditis elegans]
MYNIDFTTPRWLIIYYHSVSFTSIILNSLGFYLTTFECQKMNKYRYYLLSFQICCTITDTHLSFLMQPIPFYPILAGYIEGVLKYVLESPVEIAMDILFVIVILNIESFFLCTHFKHQSLATILMQHIFPKWYDLSIYIICAVAPIIGGIWFFLLMPTKKEQWEYIIEAYPDYLDDFQSLAHFTIFRKSIGMIFFFLFLLGGISGLLFLLTLYLIDIFRMMSILKTKISKSNYKKHHDGVRSIQVSIATSAVAVICPSFIVVIVLFDVGNAQLLTELAVAVVGTHGSINVICMLVFFPPYRDFMRKSFKKKKHRIIEANSAVVTM